MNTPMPSRPVDLPEGAWSEAALRVLNDRYTLKDEAGDAYRYAGQSIATVPDAERFPVET